MLEPARLASATFTIALSGACWVPAQTLAIHASCSSSSRRSSDPRLAGIAEILSDVSFSLVASGWLTYRATCATADSPTRNQLTHGIVM